MLPPQQTRRQSKAHSPTPPRLTRRSWASGFPPTIPGLGEYRPAAFKAAAAARLRGTAGLRWTRVVSGLLMDFFGHPHQPAPGFPVAVALDVENARAAIPGDGNAGVVLTHSADVGAFVARLLGLREWPERCFVVGDRLTWNEALVWAERARGELRAAKGEKETPCRPSG